MTASEAEGAARNAAARLRMADRELTKDQEIEAAKVEALLAIYHRLSNLTLTSYSVQP